MTIVITDVARKICMAITSIAIAAGLVTIFVLVGIVGFLWGVSMGAIMWIRLAYRLSISLDQFLHHAIPGSPGVCPVFPVGKYNLYDGGPRGIPFTSVWCPAAGNGHVCMGLVWYYPVVEHGLSPWCGTSYGW